MNFSFFLHLQKLLADYLSVKIETIQMLFDLNFSRIYFINLSSISRYAHISLKNSNKTFCPGSETTQKHLRNL